MLADPTRRTNRDAVVKHLLSYGVGKCEGPLRMRDLGKNGRYVCDDKGCVGRDRLRVDEMVDAEAIGLLARPDILALLAEDDGEDAVRAAEELTAPRRKLREAADDYAEDAIDRDQLKQITAKLRPKVAKAERRAARTIRKVDLSELERLTGPAAAKVWHGLSVARRRRLLVLFRFEVTILRAGRSPHFRPESVRIGTWAPSRYRPDRVRWILYRRRYALS